MRTIRFLLQKEFRQIFRNRTVLAMMLVVPTVQLIILPLAANYEVKNIWLAVVDHDHSPYSRQLVSTITGSGYFKLTGYTQSYAGAERLVELDKADLVLEIPAGFERKLIRENEQHLFMAVNAINGVKANLGGAYLGQIIRTFNNDIRLKWIQPGRFEPMPTIGVTYSNWFNPYMNYRLFMVPGILAVLVTMIGGYLSALNIVKEKEVGTIEQINVSPIRKHHFILGKLIPFWVLGIVVFTIGMAISIFVYGIMPAGNLGLLYMFLVLYLLAVLGLGLLISTFADTQQQAMFIAFFFVMIFILMGGLFTSVDSMPKAAQFISKLNPVTYFIEVMRMVVLKGSTLRDILPHMGIIAIFAVVLNGWAIMNYRKTS